MTTLANIVCIACVSGGLFFFLAGTAGLLRFPDALSRLHALAKADNLGLGLVAIGLMFRANTLLVAMKLILIWLLVLVSGSLTAQLIAARVRRVRK